MTETTTTAVPPSEFALAIETVRAAIVALKASDERGDLGELLDAASLGTGPLLPANVMGQLLMELLPLEDAPEGAVARMPLEAKTYWAAVAEWMGPDWLESYRRVGAFMIKVEGF